MIVTLNVKDNVIDEFMQLLKQFSVEDIVIENQSFIEEKARLEQELNSIDNVTHLKADLNKSFIPIIEGKSIPHPDVVLLDPPRAGMNPKTVNDIIKLNPPKIVYVSCNPSTQARDIKLLSEAGYKLIKIRPVDMFPHTFHIETVALLVK